MRRLTRACTELWALEDAWEDVNRKRGEHDSPPSPEHALIASEALHIYEARELGRDALLDEMIVMEYGNEEPTVVAVLAERCQMDAGETRRLIQMMMMEGIVDWRPGSLVTLTDYGRPIAESRRITGVPDKPPSLRMMEEGIPDGVTAVTEAHDALQGMLADG